jgi:soluble lytic murein transglycosylase
LAGQSFYRQQTFAIVAACVLAPAAEAATPKKSTPLPRPRPVASSPAGNVRPPVIKPARASAPLAYAATATTSAEDLAAVKKALDLIRAGKNREATESARSIGDPLARKLVEWAVLRNEDDNIDFDRYATFIAANPGWPNIGSFRRKAEAALWQDQLDSNVVRGFFASIKPVTGKGRLALARVMLAQGDRTGAQQNVREAWRQDALSADVEKQVLDTFASLLSGGDHKARMDVRFYAEDVDAGTRAAERLGSSAQLAIAKAWAGVIRKTANAGKLLDAVPEEARRDSGYIFARVQWLRRADKIAEAAQWMVSAARDPNVIQNTDEWWVERRLLARKLLDLGDAQTAYRIASEAAVPAKENARVEHHFTAGWIALRYLNDPTAALSHFARIPQAGSHPTSLARASYWQGRAAEALGRRDEARGHYERGAHYPTAYYGQLARARLGAGEMALHPAPEPAPDSRAALARLEVVRAADILYAIGERDLIIPMVADLADRADADALAVLAALAAKQGDARALLLIGKGALARGLPFDVYAFPIEGLPRYAAMGRAVEPHVAYAIARQESGFNPKVVSSANALGLMQVTPAAGRYVAKKLGIGFDQKRLLNDPVYNVQIGAAELGDLIESYGGSYILSFAAYNAGRGRVREWISRYGDPREPKVDPVDWVERIPFSETRNYVQRVLENLQVYRLRFGGSARLMIEADLRRGAAAN